ncbi:TPA: ead/Ea22-like family protein [Klebsiella pneumoniae]|nr:ead/Ea22-like family protein [Klebsiella pneumoniae]HDZ1140280.1 ead/Ea22-like family protein [Klebsiella pneumoniae]
MTTDITELAQSLKNAASKALIEEGLTWFSEEQLSHEDGIALHKADAEFIALANPANVLALVEALEKSEKTSEARREAIDRTHNMFVRERDRANAAEEALEKARQRIAELENNEIQEEGNQFLVVRHPGKVPVIKHPVGDLEDYLRQIFKADPLATIDIVTHRYYGVGGQFVEDADEYLHEMSIKVEAE